MGNSSGIVCPRCGLYTGRRVHRSFLEKLISKKRKYRCYHCKKKFFRKKPPKNFVKKIPLLPLKKKFFRKKPP
jgi:transposase-like protein